jgi:hypothetical protein
MIESIVIGAVVAVGRRLGERWIDDIAGGIDAEVRGRLKRLAVGDEGDPAQAEAARYVEDHPEVAMQLLEAASTESASEAPLIERFYSFLAFELGLIDGLGGLVALPGFFSGLDCLTVIDTRRRDRGELLLPGTSWEGLSMGEGAPFILFYPGDYSTIDFPQIWVGPMSGDAREAEVARLNALYMSNDAPSPVDLHLEPPDGTTAVRAIYERYVELGSRERLSITEPDGILMFRDAITKLVERAGARRSRWDQALESP